MKLIVGLGNPGNEYQYTRHNIGFMALDRWAEHRGLGFSRQRDYEYIRWKSNIVIKPQTYMNLSGLAVQHVLNQYKNIDDIIIIVDDIYLPLGEIRIREKGGDGGHNGLKSIIESLNSQNFKRLRIGIQEPKDQGMKDYVLSSFSDEEAASLQSVLDEVVKMLDLFLARDYKAMADSYSQYKKTYSGTSNAGIESPKEETNDKIL
ncbi:MAG TPA: aminoacyl-tRNA hydrolase [Candidatus Cloacimonadota bacterium]|nr:aminoacyl-tRNA hydrolase [Candidatus Cloacimonadota bacterium]HPT71786.1 aminoacyl-tRNA hydrolase [Candidatus Cloacimonadota bacterium]